jgi:hypothetical protein
MIKRIVQSALSKVQKSVTSLFGRGPLSNTARWVQIFYVVLLVVFAAGLINATVQPVDQRYVIFPSRGAQSISETFIDACAILLGAAGLYVSYLSGRQTTKPRMVNFYLIIALMLLASAMYIGLYVYGAKG